MLWSLLSLVELTRNFYFLAPRAEALTYKGHKPGCFVCQDSRHPHGSGACEIP
jgi:hypothetical protein